MFVDGDVEGNIDGVKMRKSGIEWVEGQEEGVAGDGADMEKTLRWAVERLMEEVPKILSVEKGEN